MGVINYEMESATLLTMCASQGLSAGMIVNRTQQETPDEALLRQIEGNVLGIVVDAARRLLN